MSITIEATPNPSRLSLLAGTELIGRSAGSGLREPPYLIRRCDGQIVQLSELLYEIAGCMDGRPLGEIADRASHRTGVRITPDHVSYIAEQKLLPLGLLPLADGSTPHLQRRNVLLGLRFRAGIVPERAVNALAGPLRALFLPPVMIAALAALVACDVWLAGSHGVSAGLRTMLHHPALGLAMFALVILSLAFHELGHAAACRYGGARPGRIGVGIYLVWPVFYTDVTDSWRLTRSGRLRTDLGGVYFNALFALAAAAMALATGYEPLLIVVVSQQILILNQFLPWVRLDGYHVVSDLIGVSDLFARIRPVLRSVLRRRRDPRISDLKPWARAGVTTWVLTTLIVLIAVLIMIVRGASGYIDTAWRSLLAQGGGVADGFRSGSVVDALNGALGIVMLLLPVAGITITYVLMCRRVGATLAMRGGRRTMVRTASTTRAQSVPAQAQIISAPAAATRPDQSGSPEMGHRDHPAIPQFAGSGAAQQAGPARMPVPPG